MKKIVTLSCLIFLIPICDCRAKDGPKFRGTLTIAQLQKMPDKDIELAIFDDISKGLTDEQFNELVSISRLSKGQQAIYVTWIVEGEVNNGGFNQFYFNSSGNLAPIASQCFERIGARKFAALVEKANKTYSEIKPRLDSMNDRSIQSFSKSYENNPLNAFDKEFYELYKNEDIAKLRVKYIRSHLSEFGK